MKFQRTTLLTLGALALMALQPIAGATVTAPADGTIFLGVRASGEPGAGVSVIINVGADSVFRSAAAGANLSVVNANAELTQAFGANWKNRNDLNWALFGARNQTNAVTYGSRAQSPVGRPASPFGAQDLTQRVATKNQIISVVEAYKLLDQFNGNPNAALQTNGSNTGSYNFQVATAGTSDFGSLSGWTSIEGNFAAGVTGTALDLFRYAGSTSVPEVEKLGTFEFSDSGALSFSKALAPGTAGIKLAQATYSVNEDAGNLALTFRRSNDVSAAVSATFSTTNGSAIAGTDFTQQSAVTVSFGVDEFTKTVNVPITDRAGISASRNFSVTLGNPSVGAVLIEPTSATVTIQDTDSEVQFASATVEQRAVDLFGNPTVVELTVNRTGFLGASSTVDATLTSTTLVNGSDFTFSSPTTITFAQGDATETLSIPLSAIQASSLPGTIVVGLGNAQGGATIGGVSSTTISVLPNSGEISFADNGIVTVNAVTQAGVPSLVTVNLTRENGSVGPASVTVTATGGSLTSGVHYVALANPTVVNFANGQTTASVQIQLNAIPANLLNSGATIVLGLSNPTNAATIGAQSSATITAVGTAGSLAFSSATYTVLEEVGVFNLPIVRSGGFTGAVSVNVSTNNDGTAKAPADFTALTGFVANLGDGVTTINVPIAILNTVANEPNETFNVTLSSPSGATLGAITSATVRILDADTVKPTLTLTAPAANAKVTETSGPTVNVIGSATDNKGVDKIQVQFNGGAFQDATFTLNAAGKADFTFPVTAQRGTNIVTVRSLDARGNISTVVTRNFIYDDPFNDLAGTYNGLALSSGATVKAHHNNGFVNVVIQKTGAFTGKLTIDGLTLPYTGVIGNGGIARFGTNAADKIRVERPNKPAFEIGFVLDVTKNAPRNKITGTVTEYRRAAIVATAAIEADRVGFDGKTPATSVPATYLENKGVYTVIFPAQSNQPGFTAQDFPQGDGVGTASIKANGTITLAATLADGTKVTASGLLWKDLVWPFYAELYAKAGSIGGNITLNSTLPESDFSGPELFWFRPFQNVQHYPYGWPEGLSTVVEGAKYVVSTTASSLPGPLPAINATNGNADLKFFDGLLSQDLSYGVNIDSKDKVTYPTSTGKAVTLTIAQATGLFTGTFTDTNGTKPTFTGVIYQKGVGRGGYGHFLSVAPKVRDGTGEAGAVTLNKKAP